MPMPLSILDVVDAIKQQVANRALGTEPQPAQPNLTPEPPPDVDYTQGMTRPDLNELGSKMEFKATPSRASAMLVALGNILQDRRNVEAARQAAAQGEYNAKLESAMDLNKARKGLQMKREFDEADPDVLMGRKLKQAELDMLPLKKEAAMADLLFKTKRADQYGQARGGRSGSGIGEQTTVSELPEELGVMVQKKAWEIAQRDNIDEATAMQKAVIETMATTNKKSSLYGALSKELQRLQIEDKVAQVEARDARRSANKQLTPAQETYKYYRDGGMTPPEARKAMIADGFKPDKSVAQLEEETYAKVKAATKATIDTYKDMAAQENGETPQPTTPPPTAKTPQPQETDAQKRVREYKQRKGLL